MAYRGRGPPSFAKPENALKRAEELIAVGQSHAALQALHDVITSKRHRTWQKVLETIMFKYVDLCVELKKGRYAKDGLIHYRNVCQQVNVASLEEVIKYFIKTATSKAEEATASAESVTLDVADLDEGASPEEIMLGFVSSEKGKDRTDRELVTPWFKFLWETYRTTLDILRNNSRLEALYAMTATKAFHFCFQYKRTTEFRRLCDTLRNHLANLNKYREQRDRPDLTIPETLQLYLETRFEQLKTACDLELWQEAFRTVEDIQGLMALGKKTPKPQLMAVYYARLTRIFTVSGSHLYNGYAWYRLFTLARGFNKNLTPTDVSGMASCVLLSALAIPPYDKSASALTDAQAELEKERSARVASILGFTGDAKRGGRDQLQRGSLLAELQAKGILNIIPKEVKEVYALLESDFNPLEACVRIGPLLDKLPGLNAELSGAAPVSTADLGVYVPALRRVAIIKTLHQLSQVYSVMRLENLAKLVPFANMAEIETIIVDAIRHGYLAVRLDHRAGTLQFIAPGLGSDRMRDHISTMARRLATAQRMITTEADPKLEQRRVALVQQATESATRDNQRALARKVLIETRKEKAERAALAAEQEEADRKLMQQRINDTVEEQRRKDEMLKRETERLQREIEQKEMEEALALMKATKGKVATKLKEGQKLDKNELMREAISEQMKERQELERKLVAQTRRADHLERARREAEAPLLQAAYQQRLQEDEVRHQAAMEERARQHRAEWEVAVAEKQRLARMRDCEAGFRKKIMDRRAEEFEALRAAREERIAERKEMMQQERAFNRKKEYARRMRVKVEEMRRAAEEQELARIAEQEAREEAERQRKMQEAAAKQRAREEEIERKAAEAKAKLLEEASRTPAATEREPVIGGAFAPSERRGGAFVPPSRRAAAAAPAAADDRERDWSRREAPPVREPVREPAPAEGGGGAWRPGRPRSDAAPPAAAEPRGEPDRWTRRSDGPPSSSAFGPSRRDEGPPLRREDGPPARREEGPPRPAGDGGRWQPSRPRADPRDSRDNRPPPPAPTRGGSRW